MTFDELIRTAKDSGYTKVKAFYSTMTIDEFADQHRDDRDYSIDDKGSVTTFDGKFTWYENIRFTNLYLVE